MAGNGKRNMFNEATRVQMLKQWFISRELDTPILER